MFLAECPTGSERRIECVHGQNLIQARLMELGFVRGESVRISRRTLFGDFVVAIKGAEVALRKEEAQLLEVSSA